MVSYVIVQPVPVLVIVVRIFKVKMELWNHAILILYQKFLQEIKDYRRKVKESQHKLYSLHRNSRKKILRKDQEIKLKKQEVTEKSKLDVNLEKS